MCLWNNFHVVICCLHAVFSRFKTKIYSIFFPANIYLFTSYKPLTFMSNNNIHLQSKKKTEKRNQTLLKITYSRHFLIRNKTAKITYCISKRQNTPRVRSYLTCFGLILFITFPVLIILCCIELHCNLLIPRHYVFLAHT